MEGDRTSYHASPRRSPRVTPSLQSPVQSVHPELVMEALTSQADFGHRNIDLFDDTAEEESDNNEESHRVDEDPGMVIETKRTTGSKNRRSGNYLGGTSDNFHSQCEEKRISSPSAIDRYMRANPPEPFGAQPHRHGWSPDSSFNESVEELSRPTNPSLGRTRMQHKASSTLLHYDDDGSALSKQPVNAKEIMGVHALTLQALQGLQSDLLHASPTAQHERGSRRFDADVLNSRFRSVSAPAKKVSMAPPAIDTAATKYPLPEHLIHTPYPFAQFRRKDFGRDSQQATTLTPNSLHATDSILTLSIQRSNPNSRLRITTLTIPTNNDFSSAVRSGSPRDTEKHFASLDFDDLEFFHQLRSSYHKLAGAYRHVGARSLSRIAVSGPSAATAAGHAWLQHAPRSPRLVASKGLSDTFSEDKLLRQFRRPGQGRARYAWVGWAHRLAAGPAEPATPGLSAPMTTTTENPSPFAAGAAAGAAGAAAGFSLSSPSAGRLAARRGSMVRRGEQHEGLEFVVSWSVGRMVGVLATVVSLSVAAALLWIFLGKSGSPGQGGGAGFRDAGDRVGVGVVVGICVLLLGLTGMGGWIGVSWLVM